MPTRLLDTTNCVSKLRVVRLRETDFLVVAELKEKANPWHQVASVIQWQVQVFWVRHCVLTQVILGGQ